MLARTRMTVLLVAWFSLAVGETEPVFAQANADKTVITVEIMLPSILGDPLQAQRWGKVFEGLGEAVRIRQPLPSDKPEIKETQRGTFRILKVVGELNRDGTLRFPGKSFTITETDQIKAWFDELKVYGAQGSPDGKKFWGLNKEQFDTVVKGLTLPVTEETKGKTVREVLDALPIDGQFKVIVHPEARDEFLKAEANVVTQDCQGLSSGTILAVITRSQGYGFRPLRTPGGTIELTIQPLSKISDPWPIGWDIDENKPRNLIVPNLFKFIQTGFAEASLQRVLDAISEQTQTPILIDERLCAEKEIDVTQFPVSYPEKKTAWSLVLGSVVRQAQLTDKIRLDEAGTPFIWVAPFIPYTPKKN